jgi:hypothetical protein
MVGNDKKSIGRQKKNDKGWEMIGRQWKQNKKMKGRGGG